MVQPGANGWPDGGGWGAEAPRNIETTLRLSSLGTRIDSPP